MSLDKGIYTAVSGAMAQEYKLKSIANNLANVDTIGYKKDEPIFKEYVASLEKQESVIDVPRIDFKPSDFYPLQGNQRSLVTVDETTTNYEQGNLKPTGNPLDLAIQGDGFFEINTPLGVRYTRAGNFSIDSRGSLSTVEGFKVLADAPQNSTLAPEQREIKLTSQNVRIAPDGSIVGADGQVQARLSIVEFASTRDIKKLPNNLIIVPQNYQRKDISNSSVAQGYVESSNVNPVQEMVDLISTQRVFDGLHNAIRAYSDIASNGTNRIADMGQ